MSDPPVPMPWSGGGHQPQDGATSLVPARLRASCLCPELRHWPANAKALCAHCSQHTGGRAGRDSLPVTARKPMGWVGSAASPPLRTTRARCAQTRQLRSGSRSPLSPAPGHPVPPEHPVPPGASCAPHPAPLLSPAADTQKLGALPSLGVRCAGDGVTCPSRCAKRGNPLVAAALAWLKETGRTPPFPCHSFWKRHSALDSPVVLGAGDSTARAHSALFTVILSPGRGAALPKTVWEDTAAVPRQKGWALGKGVLSHGPGKHKASFPHLCIPPAWSHQNRRAR